MKLRFVLSPFLFWCLSAGASPHPGTSTSALTDPLKGIYFQPQGFRLKTEGTDWLPSAQSSENMFDSVRFTPNGKVDSSASLSVRTDTLSKQTSLENYAKKWMRDYPSYGFEVLGAKSFAMANSPGLVVDMVQKEKNKQIRQVILQKGLRVVVLTCLDSQSNFQKTLITCNQLVKNFEWVADPAETTKPAVATPVAPKTAVAPKAPAAAVPAAAPATTIKK